MRSRLLFLAASLLAGTARAAIRADAEARSDAARFAATAPNAPVAKTLKTPTKAARLAFEKFSRRSPERWTIRYDKRTGAPAALHGRSAAYPGTPEQAARAFLKDAQPFLRIDPGRLSLARSNHHGGLNHLWFEQSYGGLPVEFGRVAVHVTDRGEVVHVDSKFEPNPTLSLIPRVTEADAARAVAADLKKASLAQGTLVLLPTPSDLRLAWKFKTRLASPPGSWVYYVDAATGRVLSRYNEFSFVTGTITGHVYNIDPCSGTSNCPNGDQVVPIPDESVFIHDPSAGHWCTTDANGSLGACPAAGYLFASLQGPWATVSSFAGASAEYDNSLGIASWTVDATAVQQSAHPYPNNCPGNTSQCGPFTVTIAGNGGPGNLIVKTAPYFQAFRVGQSGTGNAEGGGTVVDDELVMLSTAGTPVAYYLGSLGQLTAPASFMGTAVPGNAYQIQLITGSDYTDYGYNITFSSYLVVPNTQSTSNPYSFTWTSTMTAYGAPNEINLFYQLNAMHDFFDSTVNIATGTDRNLGIDQAVVAMSHFGPGFGNAFYNPHTNALYFGDGDGQTFCVPNPTAAGCLELALDGDATVIHHEYTHFMHNQIFPIVNTGEQGAISEGLADYWSGTSFQSQACGEPGIASFFNYSLTNSGAPSSYVPIRTMDPANQQGTPCTAGAQSLCFYTYPTNWDGEIHDDSQGFSQALWLLRQKSGSCAVNQPTNMELSMDHTGVRKSDRLVWEAMFYYPNDFVSFLEAMVAVATNDCNSSGPWGFTGCAANPGSDINNIYAAFALHGISTAPAGGDIYEPNDGPTDATDFSRFGSTAPITATIFPAGDTDVYSLTATTGTLVATLNLPSWTSPGIHFAYEMLLLDADMNEVAEGAPPYNVNANGDGFCPDGTNCLTTASAATLTYNVPGPGLYYLMVLGGQSSGGSSSITSSTQPYSLSISYPKFGAVPASIVTATVDNDTFQFSATTPQYPALSGTGNPTVNLYRFSYARLLDHDGRPLPQTQTNQAGAYLQVVGTSSSGRTITGTLQLQPGFNVRFPAFGTVSLEIFGANSVGDVVSLGASPPINLTTDQNTFEAFNNLFHPTQGQFATFRYDSQLPENGATITIYSADGQKVRTLFSGPIPAGKGSIDWHGENDAGHTVASGVYFIRFHTGAFETIKKAIVIK